MDYTTRQRETQSVNPHSGRHRNTRSTRETGVSTLDRMICDKLPFVRRPWMERFDGGDHRVAIHENGRHRSHSRSSGECEYIPHPLGPVSTQPVPRRDQVPDPRTSTHVPASNKIRLLIERMIAGTVVISAEPLVVPDVQADPRYAGAAATGRLSVKDFRSVSSAHCHDPYAACSVREMISSCTSGLSSVK